ncbi:hypothetical protein JCM8547_000814 [Rhodosporidiobolus lusitaniae]
MADGAATDGSRPAHVRSRAGCLTCRKRKKKCSEQRLPEHNGACERCFLASYVCEWPPPPGQRPVRQFQKGVRGGGKATKTAGAPADAPATGSSRDVSLEAVSASPALSPSLGSLQPYPAPLASTASMSYPSTSAGNATAPAQAQQQQPLASAHYPYSHAPSTNSSQTLAPAFAPHPSTSLSAQAAGLSGSTSLFSPFSSHAPLPAVAAPTSNLFLDQSIDAFASNPELDSFFASLDSEFGKWDDILGAPSGGTPSWGESPSAGGGGTGAGSTALLTNGPQGGTASAGLASMPVRPQAQPVGQEEMPEYDELNNAWFASIPAPVRHVVVQQMRNLATSHDAGKNAAMSMVMLFRLRQHQAEQASSDPADVEAIAQQQRRLLEAGNSHFQKSLEHLSVPDVPFNAKLLAAFDLLNYQFDVYGAGACHAILLLADFFITESLGPQPTIDFDMPPTALGLLLPPYAWTDVLRSMCVPKKRTLFHYSNLPGDSSFSSSAGWTAPPSNIQAHLGFPFPLMLSLAATVNLNAEMDALPDAVVAVKAEAIEQAVRDWRPPPPDGQDSLNSSLWMEKIGTGEMWRHAIIIFLYQAIHRHGPVSKVITASLRQILSIGARLLQSHTQPTSLLDPATASATSALLGASPAVPSPASSAATPGAAKEQYLPSSVWNDGPWFLAGTCALLPQDRELCRAGVRACGPRMQGYKDNLAALERIWQEADERGWLHDWRSFLSSLKPPMHVGFL